MEDYSKLIQRCKDHEDEALVKGAAMGAVILSRMAPRLEKDSVRKFQDLAWRLSKGLKGILTVNDFDAYHSGFMESFRNTIKSKDGRKPSYGEAQKPINVFLKTYVDRSSLPDAATAAKLRPFLHVPLDSIMIKYFRKNFRQDYDRYIVPAHHEMNKRLKVTTPTFTGKIPDTMLSELQFIFQGTYFAWQKWFRDICPNKPLLLDTIWSLERKK